MGEQIIRTGNEIVERWHQKMPRFFYWVVIVACGIGGTAFAINQGLPLMGGTHADWWPDVYRYVLGGCIGIVFICKFTVAGGYKRIDPDKLTKDSDVFSEERDTTPNEIEPYNEE